MESPLLRVDSGGEKYLPQTATKNISAFSPKLPHVFSPSPAFLLYLPVSTSAFQTISRKPLPVPNNGVFHCLGCTSRQREKHGWLSMRFFSTMCIWSRSLSRRAPPREPRAAVSVPHWSLVFAAILAVACIGVVRWLMFHATFPKFQVASAAVFSPAGSPSAAAAECNITFLLENPNRHLTIVYDRMEIALVYPSHNVLLAHDYRPPLEQPGSSRATIESNLSFIGVDFASNVVKAMVEDVVLGSLTLAINVHACVWFRNGK